MSHTATRIILVISLLGAFAPACEWDYSIWIPRSPEADALYRFRKGNRVGYIDQKGNVVIQPRLEWSRYNSGDEFYDGQLQVSTGEGVYIDTTGKSITYKNLYRAWDFSEGLAAAKETENGPWGYINTDGLFAISPRFASGPDDYVSHFSDGLALIQVNGRFGYIDHSGSFVIAPSLLDADSFHDGFARVVVEGPCVYWSQGPCSSMRTPGISSKARQDSGKLESCKFTFVDKGGRVISDKRYDDVRSFAEGLAPVEIKGKWGYIDETGTLVIATQFDKAEPFSDDMGLVRENGLYGYIDKRGVYLIAPQFKWAESFSDGRAVVGVDAFDGPVWYIDHLGGLVFKRRFSAASSFFKGLAHVRLLSNGAHDAKDRFEYIDRDGRTVFTYAP